MSTPVFPMPDRFDRFPALDIETDGLNGSQDSLVAIGVGFQSSNTDREVTVHTLADARGNEAPLIETAIEWLNRREPDVMITYNGASFDLPFLEAKLEALNADSELFLVGDHLDPFTERKPVAALANEKWPSLEESLAHYNLTPAKTMWYGEVLTNTRFTEELAPRYLGALERVDIGIVHALVDVIRHYTAADIEATMSLYEGDLCQGPKLSMKSYPVSDRRSATPFGSGLAPAHQGSRYTSMVPVPSHDPDPDSPALMHHRHPGSRPDHGLDRTDTAFKQLESSNHGISTGYFRLDQQARTGRFF